MVNLENILNVNQYIVEFCTLCKFVHCVVHRSAEIMMFHEVPIKSRPES